jgi:formate dehydrogenase iron-sulfur subunit
VFHHFSFIIHHSEHFDLEGSSVTPPSKIPLASAFELPSNLVEQLLAEQQSLTAVERFSALHDSGAAPARGLYTDLLPLQMPGPGEQYAFEVDLDRCTGCKACVTACHSLNGLDENETWRSVGLLQKVGIAGKPTMQQHVTTACHHCLEPGCAQGCPTLAYEKDAETGIVKHLDDQCFGCQYCVLKCPYDVPQYNPAKGIVRKCDLCIGRLRAGEAPACAQACPTGAIRVTVVTAESVRVALETSPNLPGAPDPAHVKPTTRYVSTRDLAKSLTPADAAQVRPEHAHSPLVFMLVASQAAAGYWVLLALSRLLGAGPSPATSFPLPELLGVLGVQGALALSLLHLGRPWLAWKAFLGWRRSWLSREVIAFTALAGTTGLAGALAIAEWWGVFSLLIPLRPSILVAVVLSAAAAIHASAMVYRDTPRALWATRATLGRFALTAAITGIPAFMLTGAILSPLRGAWGALLPLLAFAQFFKLLLESSLLRHRDDADFGPLRKGALLLLGPFRVLRELRLAAAILGGMLLPLGLAAGILPGLAAAWLASILVLTSLGELTERYLFFTTAVAPRMPGART